MREQEGLPEDFFLSYQGTVIIFWVPIFKKIGIFSFGKPGNPGAGKQKETSHGGADEVEQTRKKAFHCLKRFIKYGLLRKGWSRK